MDARTSPGFGDPTASPAAVWVTLLWHPDPRRIGRAARLDLERPAGISRLEPFFGDGEPLGDPALSRAPLQLVRTPTGVRLWPGKDGYKYDIDGVVGKGGELLEPARLAAGVVLGLGPGPLLSLTSSPADGKEDRHGLFGASAALDAVRRQIDAVAADDRPVLILGETGTGRRLVARAIHAASARAPGPFVHVQPEVTVEAEHTTDAWFHDAHGGTLFLDDIERCPPSIRARLVAALERWEALAADVRVIASDLEAETGTFRAALQERLAPAVVRVPRLADRKEDIAAMAVRFLAARRPMIAPAPGGTPWLGREAMHALLAHPWPGNVPELRSVCASLAEPGGATCPIPVLS